MTALSEMLGGLIASGSELVTGVVSSVSPLRVDAVPGDLASAITREHVAVGDVLLVGRTASGRPVAVGTLTPRPTQGVVGSVGATTATVTLTGGGSVLLEWVTKPTAGQRVVILWGPEGGVILGPCSAPSPTSGTGPPPEVPSGAVIPGGEPRPVARPAQVACTAQGGVWSSYSTRASTAWQGQYGGSAALTGFYFYGGFPTGTVSGGTLVLRRSSRGGVGSAGAVTARLRWHAAPTRPGAPPVILGDPGIDVPGFLPGTSQTITLPLAAAQKLADGTYGGVALVSSSPADYAEFDGPAQTPNSGLITLTYA